MDDAQRQFAFVKGNRPVNVRTVKQKEKSMKAYGQLTPITVTDGEKVIQMGGRLMDLKGEKSPMRMQESITLYWTVSTDWWLIRICSWIWMIL